MPRTEYQLQHRYPEFMEEWEGVGGSTEWWTEEEVREGKVDPWIDDDAGSCEYRLVPWVRGEPVIINARTGAAMAITEVGSERREPDAAEALAECGNIARDPVGDHSACRERFDRIWATAKRGLGYPARTPAGTGEREGPLKEEAVESATKKLRAHGFHQETAEHVARWMQGHFAMLHRIITNADAASGSPAGEWEAFRAGFDDGTDYADGFDPEDGHAHADDDYVVSKFQRWRCAPDSHPVFASREDEAYAAGEMCGSDKQNTRWVEAIERVRARHSSSCPFLDEVVDEAIGGAAAEAIKYPSSDQQVSEAADVLIDHPYRAPDSPADTERLDWLEARLRDPRCVDVCGQPKVGLMEDHRWTIRLNGLGYVGDGGPDLRSAIDVARRDTARRAE